MSVLFVCPVDGCGSRGFDEPPGPTQIVCTKHISGPVRLVQEEVINIQQVEKARIDVSGTEGTFGEGTGDIPTNNFTFRDKDGVQKPIDNDPHAVERHRLRSLYEALAPGQRADRRWGDARLQQKVDLAWEAAAKYAQDLADEEWWNAAIAAMAIEDGLMTEDGEVIEQEDSPEDPDEETT